MIKIRSIKDNYASSLIKETDFFIFALRRAIRVNAQKKKILRKRKKIAEEFFCKRRRSRACYRLEIAIQVKEKKNLWVRVRVRGINVMILAQYATPNSIFYLLPLIF